MSELFARNRRSKLIMGNFSGVEAFLLRSLAASLVELLADDQPVGRDTRDPLEAMLDFSGPVAAPRDPVLARLLPSAYPDDEAASADFRRFTESNLRDTKVSAASEIVAALNEAGLPDSAEDLDIFIDVELSSAQAELWLKGVNDIRLALGTRLGLFGPAQRAIKEAAEEQGGPSTAHRPGDEPSDDDSDELQALRNVYDWTSYLQDALLEALDPD